MLTPVQQAKDTLRKQIGERLRAITPEQGEQASRRARALLEQQPRWRAAQSILFYAPLPGELDIWPLAAKALEAGKRLALPRYDAAAKTYAICEFRNAVTDLVAGHWGILEPGAGCEAWATNRLDFILVPGVAFDLQGRRLGRGKGYYDQILKVVRGMRCGVAFDEQVVPVVPREPHDETLNCISTPTRWLEL